VGNGLRALPSKHFSGYCKAIEEEGDQTRPGKAGLEKPRIFRTKGLRFLVF